MNVVCENEVFQLPGLADEAVMYWRILRLSVWFWGSGGHGPGLMSIYPARMKRKERTAEGGHSPKNEKKRKETLCMCDACVSILCDV